MPELILKYPPGFENAVHLTKEELEAHVKLMAALKMFELGKISSGKAAEFAGLSRTEFYEACSRYKVSISNYSEDEVKSEIKNDLETLKKI